jgi:hypothetical protein
MGLGICLAHVMVGVAKAVIILKLDIVTEDGVFLWAKVQRAFILVFI